ncbi:MAG: phospho-N-acetylmuramoyl-pentapeptide-transferase [Patescibacteria group bacterium]|nr:phospho-N-acetylmuramoyl-pentapeptide-transferase [Patescibacteria group bacterium]
MTELEQPVNIALQITKLDLLKFIVPTVSAFIIGILSTPFIMKYVLVKYDIRKKKSVATAIDGKAAPLTASIDQDDRKVLYRMGGLVMLTGLLVTALAIWIISKATGSTEFIKLDFISRNQTWLPLFGLVVGAIVGGIDELLVADKFKGKFARSLGQGLALRVRITAVSLIGLFCGWWMAVKQDLSSLHIPFFGNFDIPVLLFIGIFVLVVAATYSGTIIDGVDGLSAGVFSSILMALGFIAITQNKFDVATLCFATVGALFAFLWFNIPPARFMLSEVGSMALTVMIAIIAFITDSVFVLPIIAAPLYLTTLSVVLQLLSKKFRGKKIFLAAPVHIHFQLIGWPKSKVTMRYWILSLMFSSTGLAVYLLGGHFR